MTQRRVFVQAAASSLLLVTFASRAQTPAGGPRRVGMVASGTGARGEETLKPFFDEMRQPGWIEGQGIVYEHVHPGDRHQDSPRLVAELVERKPDLLYALSAAAALAAKCGFFRGAESKIAIDRG